MFRKWISEFWKRNKEKITEIGKKVGGVILICYTIVFIFSRFDDSLLFTKENNNTSIFNPTKTIIKGEDISEEEYQEDLNLIDIFMDSCNNGEIEKAYDLLSDECKAECFSTLEDFKEKYYSIIFTEKREYSFQSWISSDNYNTYKLDIIDDILATGKYSESDKIQDCVTIVTDGENKKLNINNLVKIEDINKTVETEELKIEVKNKKIYTDYEIYTMQVTNNTDKVILLDDLKDASKTIQLIGSNGAAYKVFNSELNTSKLTIAGQKTKEIQIKFKKIYASDVRSNKIKFSNIILDYMDYRKNEKFNNISNIEISL